MFRIAGAAVLATVALAAGATPALAAPAPTGSTPSASNTCANPRLAQNANGWAITSGAFGQRAPITGHASAVYGYRAVTFASMVQMTLPAQAVTGGQKWTFATDSQIGGSGGFVRLDVDFYNAANARLAHVEGTPTSVGSSAWARVPLAATAPAGATRAAPSQTAALTRGAIWTSTACDYTPPATTTVPPTTTTTVPPTTTTVPPTTVPPTTTTTVPPTTTTTVPPTTTTTVPPTTTTTPPPPPGPGDGTMAASVYGWGTPTSGDEFEGTSVDTSKWGLYNSPGHDGKGLRRPGQMAVSGGVMTMSGTSDGTTGGMASKNGYKYGRWETRMRVPSGDHRYHPVLLLWPDAENWPTGGEVDYAETTCAASDVDFFLHYSSQNRTTTSSYTVDLTQWHNYAVEWTAAGIKGYVDGVLFFTDTTTSHLPPGTMHQTIQLDWFPNGSTPTTPSSLQVAWNRYYKL